MLNFIGIGAQKSGTTWLYKMLSEHPEINFPGGKEVHFWDQNYSHGVSWYKSIFSNEDALNGDFTPAYGHLPIEKIYEIHSNFPDLKIIYIIRNPIDRAWSSAKMALSRSELLMHEVSDQWFIDHFKSSGSIARSSYEENIKRWLEVFPKEQFLLERYENISEKPQLLLKNILSHLGLSPDYNFDFKLLNERVFETEPYLMRPTLKDLLIGMYRDKIISLGYYLEEDLSLWLK